MKTKCIVLFFSICAIVVCSCTKKTTDPGTLVFKGVEPFPTSKSSETNLVKSSLAKSNTHIMHTANYKGFITEISVSQGLVAEDVPDDFQWYKIGESNELKLFEEYLFTANNLPAGDYKSLKFVMKNIMSRIAVYQSDITTSVEMPGSIDENNCGDETIITQYFSKNGNHSLDNGVFRLDSEGENIRGFKIKPNEVTTIFWKLGGPFSKITDCTFDWVDVNGNDAWDCGLDRTENFNCTVDMPMFSFSIDDGEEPEEPEVILNAVTDIDGNKYDAVKIGNQYWMTENLKTTKLNDGTEIPNIINNQEWNDAGELSKSPAQCVYNNNSNNELDTYGRLYNYHALSAEKLCPTGWHVPSNDEWTTLTDYLGSRAGGKMKEQGTTHWKNPNEGADNKSGFTGLPGGGRLYGAEFTGISEAGFWWSSTDKGSNLVWTRDLHYSVDIVGIKDFDKTLGLSVRCIKD